MDAGLPRTPPRPRAHAYLVVQLEPGTGMLPVVRHLAIASQPAESLTAPAGIYATIYSTEAATFQEAHDKMLDLVMKLDALAWMRPWLEGGYDAHLRRYAMNIITQIGRQIVRAVDRLAHELFEAVREAPMEVGIRDLRFRLVEHMITALHNPETFKD